MLQHLTNAAFPVWSHILFLAGAVFNFSGSLLLWSSRVVGLKTSEVWSWYTCRVQMCPVFEILKPPRRFTIYSNLLVLLLNLRRAKWKNPAGTLPWLSVDTINIAHKHISPQSENSGQFITRDVLQRRTAGCERTWAGWHHGGRACRTWRLWARGVCGHRGAHAPCRWRNL